MLKNKALIYLIFSIFFASSFLFSQEESSSSERLIIIAQTKERIGDVVFAWGNVEIHYKDIKLFADRAEINTETKDVYAEGNVAIHMPEEVVSGEEAHINLDSSEAEIKNAFGMMQPNMRYEAEIIKRTGENIYNFQKAKITSCTQPVPRWSFSCSRISLKKDEYMEMWNYVLYIKKIPVFYFPYISYPLMERKTGFLMPQYGNSGQKGFLFSESFFWAIKRNMDATFTLDYYTGKGLGGGLEYRYMFSKEAKGELNVYYFNYRNDPEGETPANAYIFRVKHNQSLPLDFNLVADVDYSSSFNFLREFDNDFRRAVVSNRRSQVYLSRAWSYFNFNMRLSRFETYYRENDRSIIRKQFPEISFTSSKIKLFSPLHFSFSSSFSRWEYGWEEEYENKTQRRSQNLTFRPTFTLPFTVLPSLILNSSFSANLNYYFQSYAPGTTTVVDEPLFSRNYLSNVELIGPVFYKIYYGAEGEAKLKHIIEPHFSYRYESPVTESERIITQSYFYYRNHYIRYGLTNRFLIKKGKMPKEVFSFSLSQTFYLEPDVSSMSRYLVDGEIPEFSDISGNLRFYPARKYSLDVSAAFNPYYKVFSRLRLGARLGSVKDPAFLRVNWYKSINPYYEGAFWNRHQIGFLGGLKIPRLDLEIQADIDFNVKERKLLYTGFSFLYHYQCIDFKADVKVFYFRETPDVQFRISFELGNIGRTIDFFGGLEF